MRSRRHFLKTLAGALVAGETLLPSRWLANAQQCILPFPQLPPSPALEPFADHLRVPLTLRPVGSRPVPDALKKGATYYEVPMMQVTQRLHRDLPPTEVWGYAGTYPGPSIEAQRGQPIAVKWINDLPARHLLHDAIDRTLMEHGLPDVRTVVHLHGSRSLPESDGHPDAWFTPRSARKGPFPNNGIFYYPNDQPATMLWYHDHAVGITRLNVVAGLAGMYFIREPGEGSLGLPEGRYEIPLIIQDKRFNSDGSIWYPTASLIPRIHPVWNPDYFGDLAVVNGTVMPFVAVEPRLYRFRILNAANSRFFDLQLRARSSRGPAFVQIGADLGFLPAPVALENLLLSNAERADVIIDFSPFDGEDIVMENVAPNPFPSGFSGEPMRIMQFRVRRRDGTRDRSRIPPVLPAAPPLHASAAVLTRNILLTEESVPLDLPPEYCPFRVPTRMLLEERRFMDPVITEPMAGTTEIWQFINGTPVAHPMHVHLAHMQVLGRQPFDLMKFMETGQIETVGAAQPPSPNEVNASKDTVRVDLGTITRTVVKFDLPAGARVRSGDRLQYVHHCHMLEHEDNDMMRPFDVLVP